MSGVEKKNKSKKEKKKVKGMAGPLIKLAAALLIFAATLLTFGEFANLPGFPSWSSLESNIKDRKKPLKLPSDYMQLHVIDVGQGDSCVVKCGTKYILIDAGEGDKGKVVRKYLEDMSVKHLDWIIATHPDTDHIGGLEEVLKSDISIGNMMMPRLPDSMKPTTKTYEDLLQIVARKGLKITQPESGMVYVVDDIVMKVLSPSGEFADPNDYSVVLRFSFGDSSFLLTGDAGAEAEKQMIEKWDNELKSDVIKIAHHGANTSTSNEFLQIVEPKYAVISVGLQNRYKHPSDEVLLRLKGNHTECYRTDYSGDVVFSTDGTKITVKTER